MKTRNRLAPKVPPKDCLQRLNPNSELPATHFTKRDQHHNIHFYRIHFAIVWCASVLALIPEP